MTPYYEHEGITIWHADCRDVLPTLVPGSVDLVLTDPPYGIGYASAWRTRMDGAPRQHAPSFGEDEFDASWIPDAYRLLRTDRYWYLFTRWDVIDRWRAALEGVGLRICQRLVWDKCHWKMGDLRHYGSQTEDILLLRKGIPSMFQDGNGRRGNLFRYSSAFLPEGQFDHPTQKPESLVRRFIVDGSKSGQVALDPFMGSGTTLRAAKDLGRRAIGIETVEAYCEIAARRLQQAAMPLEMQPIAAQQAGMSL